MRRDLEKLLVKLQAELGGEKPKRKKRSRKLPNFLADGVPETLLGATATQRDRLAGMLMLFAGLRVSEVTKLQVEHLDLKKRVLALYLDCDDEDDLRQRLILETYPPPDEVKEQLHAAGWHSWRETFPTPIRVVITNGVYTVGAIGRNSAEAWHRVARRARNAMHSKQEGSAVLEIYAEPVPLYADPDGTIRVGESRVLLDTVIRAYKGGADPVEIVRRYDTLDVPDVHFVIGYYLRHEAEVDHYLAQREHEADELEKEIRASQPPDLREKLLARRAAKRAENASSRE